MTMNDSQTTVLDILTDRAAPATAPLTTVLSPPQHFLLLRADDLLELRIQLSGFTLAKTAVRYELHAPDGGTITAMLPPQHIMESRGIQPLHPVLSNPSILRFRVPPEAAPIPLSIDGILAAMATCELSVDAALAGAALWNDTGGSTPAAPTTPLGAFKNPPDNPVTSLFLSGRVGLTPRGGAMRFRHATGVVAHNGAVELWHTRLARLATSGAHVELPADMIGTELNAPAGLAGSPPSNSTWEQAVGAVERLTDLQALAILKQSRQKPGSLRARQLMLSPLGTWADLRGSWPDAPTVPSWRHEIAMGRDQTQRIAVQGRLYPFGHEAMLDSTTERLLAGQNGQRARLQQRSQITIREEVVSFTGMDSAARQWPFREIELLTISTPEGTTKLVPGTAALYLERGPIGKKRPFAYKCRAVDWSGRTIRFEIPLLFVPNGFTDFATLAAAYDKLVNASQSRFVVRLNSQRVAIAPVATSASAAGSEVLLDVAKIASLPGGEAGFRPIMREMTGWVPGIEDFGNDARALTMRYAFNEYVMHGFTAGNPGEVLLQIDAAPVLKLLDQQSASGLLSGLELQPRGYSRALGPVAGSLANVAKMHFDPGEFLGNALGSMKLLGVFPLAALVSTGNTLQQAPQIIARTVDGARTQLFSWTTPLFAGPQKSVDALAGRLRARPGTQATLEVRASTTLDPQTMQVQALTTCAIHNVEAAIVIAGAELVVVPLEAITFRTANGQAPDVNVALGDIGFGGVLRYVQQLAKLVDRAGFLSANGIELLPDGVRTSFSLPVPAIAVGMFVLENIAFGARLDLPFKDRVPELALNFSSFENPFHLTVLGIGGGGFVQVAVDTAGNVALDAALEFGAAVSLNLGIAKASVSIMGGIYVVLESGDFTLTGYLRVHGRAEILGIASVSVELYVGLTYLPAENALLGEAQIVATVRVLFAKKTFRIPFRKKFGGSGTTARTTLAAATFAGTDGPPGFVDAMDPAGWEGERPWDSYCLAFAA